MIRTILIIFILLFTVSATSASSATYETGTGYINIYDNTGRYCAYTQVPGLTDIVVYQGNYVYASSTNGLKVFDIRDPNKPLLMKSISFSCNSVALKNSYLYVGGKELRVYTLTNPLTPRLVNVKALPGPCKVNGLEIYQNVLYVSTSAGVKTFPVA